MRPGLDPDLATRRMHAPAAAPSPRDVRARDGCVAGQERMGTHHPSRAIDRRGLDLSWAAPASQRRLLAPRQEPIKRAEASVSHTRSPA